MSIETTVYTFEELSDTAKEKARDWYREGLMDYDWEEEVYYHFTQCAAILGIETSAGQISFWGIPVKTGEPRGASFYGAYGYKAGAAKAVRDYAPADDELRRIADALVVEQARNAYQLTAGMTQGTAPDLSETQIVDVTREDGRACADGTAEAIGAAMRDLSRWLFYQLEVEYEFRTREESSDEPLIAGGYTFTEEGRPAP